MDVGRLGHAVSEWSMIQGDIQWKLMLHHIPISSLSIPNSRNCCTDPSSGRLWPGTQPAARRDKLSLRYVSMSERVIWRKGRL